MKNVRTQKGFTLVELMVSLVLGLVVVGGVISVLVSNRNSYRTNEGLSQIQETARTTFEMLARDVRQTGGTGCDNARRMGNTLNASTAWWRNWATVQGFDGTDTAVTTGTAVGQRVANTDTLHMHSIEGGGMPIDVHNAGAATMSVTGTAAFNNGDIMLVCDFDHATIFQLGTFTAPSSLSYDTGGTPGNCSKGLGFPTDCGSGTGNSYTFTRNSWIGRLQAVTWYIGNNGRTDDGGRSLYRIRLGPGGALTAPEEVVSGVTDLQVQYGRNNNATIVDASTLGTSDWQNVNSVFITVTVSSIDPNITTKPTVNSGRITRSFTWLVGLRNRVP